MSEPLFTPESDRREAGVLRRAAEFDITQARAQGYLPQPCWRCRAYRLRAVGSCAVCESCGEMAGGCQ